jgi:hypothetical protein
MIRRPSGVVVASRLTLLFMHWFTKYAFVSKQLAGSF